MHTTPSLPPVRPSVPEPVAPNLEQQRREQAIKRIRDKNAFKLHMVAYLNINAGFVVTWAITETGYFFWPIFVILAWGAGVAIHGYSVYGGDKQTEAQIEREMKRLP